MITAEIVKKFVNKTYEDFGQTRRQEIARLLFEITKREQKDFDDVVKDIPRTTQKFSELKHYLIKRRFPTLLKQQPNARLSFAELSVDSSHRVELKQKKLDPKNIYPKTFYIEETVSNSSMVKRLKSSYSKSRFEEIPSYKKYTTQVKGADKITQYNQRTDQFFIIKEQFDFFKRCPCSNKSVYCGLHVVNLGSGCAFECAYCYLQDYINSPGIVLPANLEDFFAAFEQYRQDIPTGSGEMTDSLIFDHITEYSPQIVNFFRNYPKSSFEFKTKSDNIDLLFDVAPSENIIVAWTMSPQSVIDSTEFYTASLEERIDAAARCAEYGYKVAFHFDPIICYSQWETDYQNLVNKIFDRIDPKQVQTISLGTLRMTSGLKRAIENRFPNNTILDEEFMLSYDGKYRYSDHFRSQAYKNMMNWIKARAQDVYVYLCMEEKAMCSSVEAPPLKQFGRK